MLGISEVIRVLYPELRRRIFAPRVERRIAEARVHPASRAPGPTHCRPRPPFFHSHAFSKPTKTARARPPARIVTSPLRRPLAFQSSLARIAPPHVQGKPSVLSVPSPFPFSWLFTTLITPIEAVLHEARHHTPPALRHIARHARTPPHRGLPHT